jgi:hypothetical protein
MSDDITFMFTDEDPGNDDVVKLVIFHDRDGDLVAQRVYSERKAEAVKWSKSMPDSLPDAIPEAIAFCKERGKDAILVIDPDNEFDMALIEQAG